MASSLLNTVANFETFITAKLTAAGTSLTLAVNADKDGNTLPDGVYGFTIDEGLSSEEHVIGTKTGTAVNGLIRNVSRIDGVTAQAGKEHRKNAPIKITDYPLLVRLRRVLDGIEAFDATNPLRYDAAPVLTPGSNELVTVAYADSLVAGGVADATNASKGKVRLSVAAVSPADPIVVGDNDGRVPTQGENDALAGTAGTPSASNKFVTNDDTTGTGPVLRASKATRKLFLSTSEVTFTDGDGGAGAGVEQTLFSVTVPGGTLSTNNGVRFKIFIRDMGISNGTNQCIFQVKYGGSTQIVMPSGSTGILLGLHGFLEGFILADGAANAQKITVDVALAGSTSEANGDTTVTIPKININGHAAGSVDSSIDQTLAITLEMDVTSDHDCVVEWCIVEAIQG